MRNLQLFNKSFISKNTVVALAVLAVSLCGCSDSASAAKDAASMESGSVATDSSSGDAGVSDSADEGSVSKASDAASADAEDDASGADGEKASADAEDGASGANSGDASSAGDAAEKKADEAPLPECYMTDECLEKLKAGDTYTVYDVDCDGRQELVICAENDLGESVQTVYDLDSDNNLFTEISIPYSLLFYSNGNMMALWPNNKGLNPDMMPYNMYSYNADEDIYEYAGYVDSWNLEYNETDYEGNDFPTELDKDEDGLLYSIYYGDDFGYGYTHDGDDLDKVLNEMFNADILDPIWKRTSTLFE